MSNNPVVEIVEYSSPPIGFVDTVSTAIEVVETINATINIGNLSGNTPVTFQTTTQSYLSGVSLSALRLVKLNSSNQLVYADNSTDATVLGLTFQAVSTGVAPITVLSGLITDSGWNWARGAPLFLGSNGQITTSIPSSGFIVPIGNAEAPTIINLNISQGVQIS